LDFTKKNDDAQNNSDDYSRSNRDSSAGKHLCSELGNKSDINAYHNRMVSDNHSANLLLIKSAEENFLASVA